MNHEHPDANLLAAFTEKRLRGREREDLLAHLADCGDCRQILALSSEPVRPAKLKSISPAWRWAAAAAVAALVLTATWGLRLIVLTQRPLAVTRNIEPAPIPPSVTEPEITSSATARTKPRPAPHSSMPKTAAARARPELPAPPAVSTDEIAAAPNPEQDKVASLPAAPPYKIAALDLRAAKKVAPPQPGSVRQVAAPMSGSFGRVARNGFVPPSPVLWRVSSPVIERSLDGGVTWQPVSISDGVQFQAVAVSAADVWAGGAKGALFLSRDAGFTWKKVAVAQKRTELSGTILAIRLPAPSEIILETDAGETWTSRDGGATWSRL